MTSPTVGESIGSLEVHLTRADLVRYAGASGDFNPIHYNARVAQEVGLPDVIAHGMLTMALGARLVTQWAGDPAAVVDYGVRFTRPVVVPDPAGVDVRVEGVVGAVEAAADGAAEDAAGGVSTARVDLTVTVAGKTVLGRARATVRCTPAGA